MAGMVNSVNHTNESFGEYKDHYASNPSFSRSASDPFNNASTLVSNPDHAHSEKHSVSSQRENSTRPSRRCSGRVIALFVFAAFLLVLAVALPIALSLSKPRHHAATEEPSQKNDSSPTKPVQRITSGGDGSTVTTEDGATFIYSNQFGGFWVSDPNDPFNNNAQPNTWTPPLNQSWDFNQNKIYGVNLGGLFVLEPFISPALFQRYPGATDEWSLSLMMAADTANGGLNQLEQHYATFITEKDIADIAGAGLNWVRVPIPFWAIDKWDEEPFLERTSWQYIVRLFGWCRKYGIRVNLDLHTMPGSQNGYNHSGRYGQVNFLHGIMGLANAQRALNYIRIIAEFISQPEWRDVVPMFGFMNEPLMATIGPDQLRSFYVEAHRIIRNVGGYGAGNGPYVSFHDGFFGPVPWADFMRGADRVVMDLHPYVAFSGGPNTDPIATGTGDSAGGIWPGLACQRWDGLSSDSRNGFGITVAGEWSNGFNDCGLFLDGVGFTPTYGDNCEDWQNSANWDDATKAGILKFASASMDALDSWFFWTWKIGNSTRGIVESPLWSYQLGLEGGWIPRDPRTAYGTCNALGSPLTQVPAQYPTWMTGGDGAGPPQDANEYPWPPAIINEGGPAADIPQYTATGTAVTLTPPTFTGTDGHTISSGNGWFNSHDVTPAPTPIQGCTYPDAWNPDVNANLPQCRA
ncbi:glycoside hydrolase [Coprinopsis marcescibilis]|uniref:glucan 1,3-beta-glucosidase n=1 Tax=Coprinopsis marcescibilis TaxID=230819 RepID=A0A5C3KH05_COPMA|nr:glycoside hydrolase [Coprinopsis marcescibilis]